MARVLVIDDDRDLRELFSQVLQRGGHDARMAGSAREALEQLHQDGVDLVVTDVVMPDKDGLETIRDLRREFPQLPVVAVSGGGSLNGIDYLRMARLLGARRTLSKPVRAQQLLTAVRESLETPAQA